VHQPLCRLVLREIPPPFRPLLRRDPARARLSRFRFGCAAQRSVTRRSGRPRRRRAAAAPRRCRIGYSSRPRAAASSCTADGGDDSAGALTHSQPIAAAETAHPFHSWALTLTLTATSNRRIRRLPKITSWTWKPSLRTAGRGGGPHGVTPVYPTGTRKQNSQQTTPPRPPRVDYGFGFGESLTETSTPSGLGVLPISHPARASIKRAKLQKVVETAIAGEGGGEKLQDSARRQGSVRVTELDVVTGTDERLHAASQLPGWCLT
jgi:hypothetical protein